MDAVFFECDGVKMTADVDLCPAYVNGAPQGKTILHFYIDRLRVINSLTGKEISVTPRIRTAILSTLKDMGDKVFNDKNEAENAPVDTKDLEENLQFESMMKFSDLHP